MVWDLDKHDNGRSRRYWEKYIKEHGYDKGTHPDFKVGDTIQFMTGYNNDILAQSRIKGINGNDLYVYNDCYWFPIRANDATRKIRKIEPDDWRTK